MATLQVEELSVASQGSLDIVGLVENATWKDLLIDLVHRNRLDPWNVDIAELIGKYIEAVRSFKVMDLRVPANIILAAAILLRLKSEMLGAAPEAEELESESYYRPSVSVEELVPRLRLPPARRVALGELIAALEDAMKLKEHREHEKLQSRLSVPITINTIDIEADIESLYSIIKGMVDGTGMITLARLVEGTGFDDPLLSLFVPLLFLANRNKVVVVQERFFDEIFIRLNS